MRRLRCLLVVVLVASCSPDSPASTDPWEAAIDSIAREVLTAGPIAGLSVAVVRDGEVAYARGHGSANVAEGQDATHETVYVAASVSKFITSLAVLTLVRDGRLELDDSLADRLPSFPNLEQGQRITVRHMLNHTSGLHDLLGALSDESQESGTGLDRDFVLQWLQDRPLDFEPGTHWMYSNTGFYLLGLIIEEATGQSYGDYVRNEVALPLGLQSTFLCDDWLFPERRTIGYETSDTSLVVSRNYETTGVKTGFGGAGGICSTVADLASLPAALESTGLVPNSLLAEMLEPTTISSGATVDYGLGVRLGTLGDETIWGHSGGSGSTWALFAHYPGASLTVAAMVNTDRASPDAWILEGRVARKVLGLSQERPDSVALAEAQLYEGRYVGGRGDRQFDIRVEGARLLIQQAGREGSPTQAVAVGPHEFVLANNPNDRIIFEVRDGAVLDGLFSNFRRPAEGYLNEDP